MAIQPNFVTAVKSTTLLFVCLLLTACYSTPEVQPGMARFDSPEVNREPLAFKLSIGSDTINQIPLGLDEATGKDATIRLAAAVSVGNGIEIKYSHNGDDKIGIKYQFFGAPLEEKVAGNFAFASSISYIRSSLQDEYPTTFWDGNAPEDYVYQSWSLRHNSYDLALIAGYRVTPQVLLYGSLFYQQGDINGKNYLTPRQYSSYAECDNDPACFIEYFNDDGKAVGANLAIEVEISRWIILSAEAVHHRANWFNRNNNQTAANLNAEFRF